MHCSRVLRVSCSQSLLARASPARSIFLLPNGQQIRFASKDTKGTKDNKDSSNLSSKSTNQPKKDVRLTGQSEISSSKDVKFQRRLKKEDRQKAAKREFAEEEEDIEEAGEGALKASDETKPPVVLNQLRHQQRNPVPGMGDVNPLIEDDAQQREVKRIKEQLQEKKSELLKRAEVLASMDTSDAIVQVEYDSIEAAYKALKADFDIALMERKPDAVYDTIKAMRNVGLRLPKPSYDAAAVLFAEEQHIYKARDVWEFMRRDEIFPDQDSFMNVVTIYCHMTQYEWAMKTFFKMCEYLCPNPEAYEKTMELFSKNTHIGNLRKAEQIFHTIHRFDINHTPTACAAFIRSLCASGYEGDGDRAIDILKYMKTKAIGPVPPEVPGYFVEHIRKFVMPGHHFVRAKKVLRGCQNGGLPEEPFKAFWDVIEAKPFVNKIQRADLAAPLEKMTVRGQNNPYLRLG